MNTTKYKRVSKEYKREIPGIVATINISKMDDGTANTVYTIQVSLDGKDMLKERTRSLTSMTVKSSKRNIIHTIPFYNIPEYKKLKVTVEFNIDELDLIDAYISRG